MHQRFLAFFGIAALWQDNAHEFQKAQNGDLVMRQSGYGFGYFLLFPLINHTAHWHRWRVIPSASSVGQCRVSTTRYSPLATARSATAAVHITRMLECGRCEALRETFCRIWSKVTKPQSC
jgi:hypothetical protein